MRASPQGYLQVPLVQGTPLQQSPEDVQAWPYCAHPPESVVPESVVPESEGSTPPSLVVVPPQMPLVEPVGTTQGSGEQQSAVMVHSPPLGTHDPSHLLFTHGLPQQSALVAQSCPAGTVPPSWHTKLTARQRGIPSASSEQHASGLLLQKLGRGTPPSGSIPRQQLFDVPPQLLPWMKQTAPGRRHCANGQRP
jgi:hypothetical protein